MNRKHFLGTAATLVTGAAMPFSKSMATGFEETALFKKPPYLKKGDVIGVTSPAGAIKLEEIQPAIAVMQSWGYAIKTGDTIGKKDFGFGGTDEERLNDLQQMLDDPTIKAIMCARGGYGSLRIVDRINWTKFKAKAEMAYRLQRHYRVAQSYPYQLQCIATIHSKMINSFPDDWTKAEPIQIETIISIQDALAGKKMSYTAIPNAQNKTGMAEGILTGGNLKTIENLAGSSFRYKDRWQDFICRRYR
jgi:muramoyltetrapeptide carboxypeptidase